MPTPRSRRSSTRRRDRWPRQADSRGACASSPARAAASARRASRRFQREGAKVVGVDLLADSPGDLALQVDVTSEAAGRRDVPARAQRARPHRRAVQQRRHLAHRRRLGARDRARGLGARPAGQPAQRVPVLQARHPASARERRAAARLGHQHRLVRRRDGRRHLADLLHRLEGRRARDVARARRRVRAPRRARQRALPGTGRHAAAAGAVRRGPRAGRAAPRARADRALRASRGDRQRGAVPRRPTSRASSPPRRSSSTAGSAAPTRRRCRARAEP